MNHEVVGMCECKLSLSLLCKYPEYLIKCCALGILVGLDCVFIIIQC